MHEKAAKSREKFDQIKFEEAKCKFSQEIDKSDFSSIEGTHWRDPDRKLLRSEVFFSVLEVLNLYGLKETLEKIELRFSNSIVKKRDQDEYHKHLFINKVDYLYDFFHFTIMGLSTRARFEKNFFDAEDWIEVYRPHLIKQTLPLFKEGFKNRERLQEVFTLARDIIEA